MKTSRIGVLMGGASSEKEISLKTGRGVEKALREIGYEVVPIVLGEPGTDVCGEIRDASIDIAFIALHGRGGEDGCIQGLLEWMGIPYTGSSVLASALAMDKLKAKEMFRLHNVPTPPYYVATAAQLAGQLLEEQHGSFGFPVIVKPRGEGSSVGLARADNMSGLRGAVMTALAHDSEALVERFIKATEVHVGVVDGKALGAIEVVPKSGLFDYQAKYTAGMTEFVLPPRLPATRLRGVMNLAERAASSLGCTGACRVDCLVTEGENEYVLEVNTLPGMTATSLLPQIAAHVGIEYSALCEKIVLGAKLHAQIHRGEKRNSSVVPRATGTR